MTKKIYFIFLCSLVSFSSIAQDDFKTNMEAFLKKAISEGLQKDKFPLKISADILADKDKFFVPKCPICTPISSAFEAYNAQKIKVKRTKLDKTWLRQIQSSSREEQHLAFKDLIERYVSEAYIQGQFTEAEKEAMESKLRVGRKKGMTGKTDEFGKFCPSCDGACKIKKQ
jgi:hypothetical protein